MASAQKGGSVDMGCGCRKGSRKVPDAVNKARQAKADERRAVYDEARRRLAAGGKVVDVKR